MVKKNVFVFPCGSEIGLEIYRSVKTSIHFNLIGGSSADDHGKFVYQNYIGEIPFLNSETFIDSIKEIVISNKIDIIYPTMDSVMAMLKAHEQYLGCKVIGSKPETQEICVSKKKTYQHLHATIRTPLLFTLDNDVSFPIFAKPDIGYGSRGVCLIQNSDEFEMHYKNNDKYVYCEYLPGNEYTVDCFTDRHGNLRFSLPRIRGRIRNGISVYTTKAIELTDRFNSIIQKINAEIEIRGAWFVQLKEDVKGDLVLLEIASRFGGSSALSRMHGVNLPLLSLFDALDYDVQILYNEYNLELDRALDVKFKLDIHYNEVFIDYDDCIHGDGKVNIEIISFLYQCVNKGINITLLTRHKGDLVHHLEKNRIKPLFNNIILVPDYKRKSEYIHNKNSIFIDDSFQERKDVKQKCKIPVFSPDMIQGLIN